MGKRILRFELKLKSYWQNIDFHEIASNFTYSQQSQFFKLWNFLDQLILPYKSYGREMWGILFFIFASCEPLTRYYSNAATEMIF